MDDTVNQIVAKLMSAPIKAEIFLPASLVQFLQRSTSKSVDAGSVLAAAAVFLMVCKSGNADVSIFQRTSRTPGGLNSSVSLHYGAPNSRGESFRRLKAP